MTIFIAYYDFFLTGSALYGGTDLSSWAGLGLVVGETIYRTIVVFCVFVVVLGVNNMPNLSRRALVKCALVTMAVCGLPPLALSAFLNNYLLFIALESLLVMVGRLLGDAITKYSLGLLLFLSLDALTLEFPRLVLSQHIWQTLILKTRQRSLNRV